MLVCILYLLEFGGMILGNIMDLAYTNSVHAVAKGEVL